MARRHHPRLRHPPDRAAHADEHLAAGDRAAHADEHLAAGDAAAALAGYAGLPACEPAEPDALAGWIVARAALEPGRATRRGPARPERLQPLPSR